jgi:hypothetical protein
MVQQMVQPATRQHTLMRRKQRRRSAQAGQHSPKAQHSHDMGQHSLHILRLLYLSACLCLWVFCFTFHSLVDWLTSWTACASCRSSQLQRQAAVVVLQETPQTRSLSRHMALRCVERGQRARRGMAVLRHFLLLLQ